MRREFLRLIKYGLVGVSGVIINFTLLYILTEFIGFVYMLSAVIAVTVAASSNYMINHHWSFNDVKHNNTNKKTGWLKYVAVKGFFDVVYLGLIFMFTEMFGLWYMFSAVLALSVTALPGYILVSLWIWKRKVWQIGEGNA